MDIERFSERTRGFLRAAQNLAASLFHQQLTPVHLLKVLLDDIEGFCARLIDSAGGDAAKGPAATQVELDRLPRVEGAGAGAGQIYTSAETIRALEQARTLSEKAGDLFVTVERVLLALTMAAQTPAAKILSDAGVTPQSLNRSIKSIRKGRKATSANAEKTYDALKRYERDLTAGAGEGKTYPVIGRYEEIRRTIQVLSRRTKNNPVLIGELGVGKTAIVEGLAQRIVNGDVPEGLEARA